jgi:4'-phosphopantetheinyl transferase
MNLRISELCERVVHVWPVPTESTDDVISRFRQVLTQDETERAARFRFEHLQRSYILSRGALRVILGSYLDIDPAAIQITYTPRGKPRLALPLQMDFNASHSGGLALLGFTRNCEIGLDIELIRTISDMEQIADRFFCAEEARELNSLPTAERQRAFFLCWTRKEAYIKATGEGLSTPLDAFRVTLQPGGEARFIHIARDTSAAEAWTLHHLEPASNYVAALAYRDAPRQVHLFPAVKPADLLPAATQGRW